VGQDIKRPEMVAIKIWDFAEWQRKSEIERRLENNKVIVEVLALWYSYLLWNRDLN
jgi:hypothetical protein